jgi:uncharacterized protein (DUF2141 family)
MGRILALAILLSLVGATAGQAADLTVAVTGVQDGGHSIRIVLYGDADSFRHEERARQVLSLPAVVGTVTGTFHDLPAGRYAVLAYHDANDNRRLDLVLGMFPSEGWGLSNDPSVIGPPRFADSAFDLAEPGAAITVPLHY